MSRTSRTLAIVNARVWTGDPRRPWADAVLVDGGSIEAVGSSAEVKKRLAEGAVIIDAKKMIVAARPSASGEAGVLRRGMPASLIVVRAELMRVTPEDLREEDVVLEVRDGQVVFDQDHLAR